MITYIKYSLSTSKGETSAPAEYNTPFRLGGGTAMDEKYTGSAVVEAAEAGTGAQSLAWLQDGDIVHGVFPVTTAGVTTNYDIKLVKANTADIYGFYNKTDKKFYSDASYSTQITVAADTKVAYKYDNVVVPQRDLPRIKAEMVSIPLVAKARRVAVFYSQIAAFQAKTDYGFDLGDQLAEQACGRLQYKHFVPLAA